MEKNKALHTAEEFLQNHNKISHYYDDKTKRMVCFDDDVKQAMIEFAKLHAEAAVKTIHKKLMDEGIANEADYSYLEKFYPLNNIK